MRYYLDANSTLPCDNIVEYAKAFEGDGNPSSLHGDGQKAKKILTESKERIAKYFGSDPYDCYFVSCATEGITQLMQGYAEKNKKNRSL